METHPTTDSDGPMTEKTGQEIAGLLKVIASGIIVLTIVAVWSYLTWQTS